MANENEQIGLIPGATSGIKALLKTPVAGLAETREFQQSTRTGLESLAAKEIALMAMYDADKVVAAAAAASSSARLSRESSEG